MSGVRRVICNNGPSGPFSTVYLGSEQRPGRKRSKVSISLTKQAGHFWLPAAGARRTTRLTGRRSAGHVQWHSGRAAGRWTRRRRAAATGAASQQIPRVQPAGRPPARARQAAAPAPGPAPGSSPAWRARARPWRHPTRRAAQRHPSPCNHCSSSNHTPPARWRTRLSGAVLPSPGRLPAAQGLAFEARRCKKCWLFATWRGTSYATPRHALASPTSVLCLLSMLASRTGRCPGRAAIGDRTSV